MFQKTLRFLLLMPILWFNERYTICTHLCRKTEYNPGSNYWYIYSISANNFSGKWAIRETDIWEKVTQPYVVMTKKWYIYIIWKQLYSCSSLIFVLFFWYQCDMYFGILVYVCFLYDFCFAQVFFPFCSSLFPFWFLFVLFLVLVCSLFGFCSAYFFTHEVSKVPLF